jgi:hypothetical protein
MAFVGDETGLLWDDVVTAEYTDIDARAVNIFHEASLDTAALILTLTHEHQIVPLYITNKLLGVSSSRFCSQLAIHVRKDGCQGVLAEELCAMIRNRVR